MVKPKITPVQKILDGWVMDFIGATNAYRTKQISINKFQNKVTASLTKIETDLEAHVQSEVKRKLKTKGKDVQT